MILDTLAAASRKRVIASKENIPLNKMKELAHQASQKPSFKKALATPGISFICEVKRASPSKGMISPEFPYQDIAKEYESAGAHAISVLTEPEYFLGREEYLTEISQTVKVPLLRKDFTVDPYQIYEAKAIGASAVLLICAILDTNEIREGIKICNSLGLDALVEAHNEEEIQSALTAGATIIGVNNRDLKTFEVDFQNSIRLRNLVPDNILFVAESGIKTEDDIRLLHQAGVDAVLIGESLMRSPDKERIMKGFQEAAK